MCNLLSVTFSWDPEKNALLKRTRGVSFEEIVASIEDGGVLGVFEHLNQKRYRNQRVYLAAFMNYVFVVPFVRDEKTDKLVLKTIYPSRKYHERSDFRARPEGFEGEGGRRGDPVPDARDQRASQVCERQAHREAYDSLLT